MCATEDFFTPERRQSEFDDALRRAILAGEPHTVICPTNLDEDTVWAVNALAAEFRIRGTNQSWPRFKSLPGNVMAHINGSEVLR